MFNKLRAIIRKDTMLRFEGPGEWLFFLVLPIAFTFILGGGQAATGGGDNRIVVPVVDLDNSARSAEFVAALAASDVIRPETAAPNEADEQLRDGDAAAVLIIPAGFGAALESPDGVAAEIVLREQPGDNAALAVAPEVQRAAAALAAPRLIARNSVATVESVRPFADAAARAAYFDRAVVAAAEQTVAPDARVAFVASSGGNYDPSAQASAGQLITWVFIPLLGASGLFALERALGTLRRLMTTPTSRSTFMLGTVSSQFLAALVQMTILVAFGILVMRVPWGQSPAALAVILVTFGLAGVALGAALGTFVKSESQATSLSIMTGMAMALLGGCWWPLELFPPALQQAVRVLPTTWAMSAMTDITMRGAGLVDILPEAAVLLGFAVVFFVVGVWRFRYE